MLDVAFPQAVIGTCPFQVSYSLFCIRYRLQICLEQNVRFPLALDILILTCLSAGLASTWGLMFLFDLIIFGMTLYKTLTFRRLNNSNTLITVLMRDGECRQTSRRTL